MLPKPEGVTLRGYPCLNTPGPKKGRFRAEKRREGERERGRQSFNIPNEYRGNPPGVKQKPAMTKVTRWEGRAPPEGLQRHSPVLSQRATCDQGACSRAWHLLLVRGQLEYGGVRHRAFT